jgi:Flp pilus assembly protein TadB
MALYGAIALGTMAGYSIYSGERANRMQQHQLRQQDAAQMQALQQSEKQRQTSEQAMNRANQRTPNVRGIMEGAMQQAAGGPSGTMLTGPMGVDPSALALGRSTLLGS